MIRLPGTGCCRRMLNPCFSSISVEEPSIHGDLGSIYLSILVISHACKLSLSPLAPGNWSLRFDYFKPRSSARFRNKKSGHLSTSILLHRLSPSILLHRLSPFSCWDNETRTLWDHKSRHSSKRHPASIQMT